MSGANKSEVGNNWEASDDEIIQKSDCGSTKPLVPCRLNKKRETLTIRVTQAQRHLCRDPESIGRVSSKLSPGASRIKIKLIRYQHLLRNRFKLWADTTPDFYKHRYIYIYTQQRQNLNSAENTIQKCPNPRSSTNQARKFNQPWKRQERRLTAENTADRKSRRITMEIMEGVEDVNEG